jgi:hypothetical protein
MKTTFHSPVLAILLAVFLHGCAAVQHTPAQLQPLSATFPAGRQVLAREVQLQLDTGYSRTLKPGSEWQPVGSLPQGTVYSPVNDVFTLEGAHIHEAYLVVQGQELVGFYLPAERGLSRLNHPLPIQFQ